MSMSHKDPQRIKSVNTTFAIVQSLQVFDGAGVTELANWLDLSKSTVHKHLKSLEMEEYVVNEDGIYRLGLRFLDHGMYVRSQIPLVQVAKPSLQQLAEETGEVVWLVVEEHGRAVYLYKAQSSAHSIDPRGEVGRRPPIHCLASGKAILSQLSRERVEEIIDRHGLARQSEHTITGREELFRDLDAIRDRNGVAFNDNEEVNGLRAVGVPIVSNGEVRGAISVSGPAHQLEGERFRSELPTKLLRAANEIELKLFPYTEPNVV